MKRVLLDFCSAVIPLWPRTELKYNLDCGSDETSNETQHPASGLERFAAAAVVDREDCVFQLTVTVRKPLQRDQPFRTICLRGLLLAGLGSQTLLQLGQ